MIPFTIVNAFTREPFGGNPAAVMLLVPGRWPEDAWMQGVAAQFNLAETAFVLPARPGEAIGLRWMTPQSEVDLCGHATLGAAHTLWETGRLGAGESARFDTRSGRLTCERQGDTIAMDFPAIAVHPVSLPELAKDGLRLVEGRAFSDGIHLLIEVDAEADVRAAVPDFAKLARLDEWGVIVTARGKQADFVSRFFAPRKGVPEDPVTGSAHCRLTPFWAAKLGRASLTARQLSARGGELGVELRGDRVVLRGKAVTTGRGEWVAGEGDGQRPGSPMSSAGAPAV